MSFIKLSNHWLSKGNKFRVKRARNRAGRYHQKQSSDLPTPLTPSYFNESIEDRQEFQSCILNEKLAVAQALESYV